MGVNTPQSVSHLAVSSLLWLTVRAKSSHVRIRYFPLSETIVDATPEGDTFGKYLVWATLPVSKYAIYPYVSLERPLLSCTVSVAYTKYLL